MKSLIAILLICLSISSLSQTTLTVTNLNDSGPGSLRQQVFNSNSGDRIVFDASLLNNGNDTLFLNFPIIVDNGLSITGLIRGGDTLFISGHDSTQIFYMDFSNIPGQEVYLDSLAVIDAKKNTQNGPVHTENGGAIFVMDADSLVITNSIFRSCRVDGNGNGGAIYCYNAALTILKSSFIGNHTDNVNVSSSGRGKSGAIEIRYGQLTIHESNFENNFCGDRGGAMYIFHTDFHIKDSRFIGNYAGGFSTARGLLQGGAIRTFEVNGLFENCLFHQNRSSQIGGALAMRNNSVGSTSVQIVDCIFSENTATNSGGAISATSVYLKIASSTFISNKSTAVSVADGGGALFLIGGKCEIYRSTLIKNQSIRSGGAIHMGDNQLLIEQSTIVDNSSGNSYADIDYRSNEIDSLTFISSVIARRNGRTVTNTNVTAFSLGNNIFSDSPSFAIASDQTNIDSTTLALEPLAMNGGLTPTMLPSPTSVALNMGNPTDFSDAQNGPIYGRRDVGAAERPVISYDTTSACTPVSWWGNTYGTAGTYSDTAYNANSIDSVGVLVLELQDTSVFDLDGTLYASEQDTNTTYQWVDCDNNYAVIVGATSRGFLPPANGNYAVILTNQNCVDTSSCISYNRFSISERSTTEDWLTFYPNPTSGVIHYSFTGNAPMQVEVLDLSGRNVTTFELDGETTLQLPSLANGTYLLRWMGSQGEVQVDRICVVE